MAGPGEFLVTLMTALILPAVVILIIAFFTGSLDDQEDAKYMAVMGEPDAWEQPAEVAPDDETAERRWAT